jgi:hypothetical protein
MNRYAEQVLCPRHGLNVFMLGFDCVFKAIERPTTGKRSKRLPALAPRLVSLILKAMHSVLCIPRTGIVMLLSAKYNNSKEASTL